MGGDLTLGVEQTTQYADDVLKNCATETFIILQTNVTWINSIKKEEQQYSKHTSKNLGTFTTVILFWWK